MFQKYLGHIDVTMGGKYKKLSPEKEDELKDWMEFQVNFRTNILKALTRYRIEGVPDTCDERVIRESFLFYASCCFFEKDGSLLSLPGSSGTDGVTLYGRYTNTWVYGRNGFVEKVPIYVRGDDEEKLIGRAADGSVANRPRGVLVWENEIKSPFFDTCLNYSIKMASCMRNLDVASDNATVPLIMSVDSRKFESVDEIVNGQKYKHRRAIVVPVEFDPKSMQMMPIQTATDGIKAHTDLFEWYTNRYDALCGKKTNANTDKAERMSTVEVNAGNEAAEVDIDTTVAFINKELELVNDLFGTSMKCYKNEAQGEPDSIKNGFETFGQRSVK